MNHLSRSICLGISNLFPISVKSVVTISPITRDHLIFLWVVCRLLTADGCFTISAYAETHCLERC